MTSRPRPRDIASFLLALAGTGCASPIGDFSDEVCLGGPPGLGELAPVTGTDFVGVRSSMDATGATTEVARWGAPCASATDANACQAALAALPTDPPLTRRGFDVNVFYDVVYTRGDEVGRAKTPDEVLGLLGGIDSPGEAVLAALAAGKDVICGESNTRKVGASYVLLGGSGSGCGEGNDIVRFEITVEPDGTVSTGPEDVIEAGDPNCAIGRRPPGLRSRGRRSPGVGAFFASAAHLEAASVPAFRHLARELAHHGAPRSLVRACVASARDEIRHARVVTRLARRYGARPVRVDIDPTPLRGLLDIAIDNAAEGMVKETFGAVVAAHQAQHAVDPVVRRALAAIALDESRHAALSYRIDGWLAGRLSASERRRVGDARRAAAARLAREVAQPLSADLRIFAGMPGPAVQARWLETMGARLAWT